MEEEKVGIWEAPSHSGIITLHEQRGCGAGKIYVPPMQSLLGNWLKEYVSEVDMNCLFLMLGNEMLRLQPMHHLQRPSSIKVNGQA